MTRISTDRKIKAGQDPQGGVLQNLVDKVKKRAAR